MSTVDLKNFDLTNPTETHQMLRDTLKSFVQAEVEPQAHEHDKKEKFNLPFSVFLKTISSRPGS